MLMREILFRGKTESGEFAQGYYLETLRYNNLHWIWNGKEYVKVDPSTVGQFTGLIDKNGKKIFEGDIVRHYNKVEIGEPDTFVIGKIFWQDKRASFYRTTDEQDNWDYRPIDDSCVYEVIGNIHDNPELLEVNGDD